MTREVAMPTTAPDPERLRATLENATATVRRLEEEYEILLADPAAIQEDRDGTRAILESARETEALTRRALDRVEQGTYGRCTHCGVEIPPERLEAIPGVETCVSCS
jgi:DnaK suppressor protein